MKQLNSSSGLRPAETGIHVPDEKEHLPGGDDQPPPCSVDGIPPEEDAPASYSALTSIIADQVLIGSNRPTNKSKKPGPAENPETTAFRRRYFPRITDRQWNDWRWQLKNRLTTRAALSAVISLSPEEEAGFARDKNNLPVSVTPYYLSLVDADDPHHPLRRCVIPSAAETVDSPGEAVDPLAEDHDSVSPGLVHRYPDRVLLLATGVCASYCRYCTRSRMVAGQRDDCGFDRFRLEKAFAYIRQNRNVRDVLISGGDPLTLPQARLEYILDNIRRIEHVEIIRIGTKVPVVLPQRITPSLVQLLKKYHPLFISIHFTHPAELTPETARACTSLADAGIPLGSQTVLLKDVNDNLTDLKKLFTGLLKIRVRPYYLYQCDPITGSAHFRTPVDKGLEMIRGLRGHTTGYAVPTYVIDAPGGGGKIALYPESMLGRRENELVLRNYEGREFNYPEIRTNSGSHLH